MANAQSRRKQPLMLASTDSATRDRPLDAELDFALGPWAVLFLLPLLLLLLFVRLLLLAFFLVLLATFVAHVCSFSPLWLGTVSELYLDAGDSEGCRSLRRG